MKVAALDLGSNTFLMLIADVDRGRVGRVYRDEMRVVRLGQGVHESRRFHPEALARAEECFRDYSGIIAEENVDKIIAMATSASRDVSNAAELFALGDKYGIPIEIIPGSREAEITFRGSTFDFDNPSGVVVIDVGGGSTEVIGRDANGRFVGESVDVGSVRLSEMFVKSDPVNSDELADLATYAREKFVACRDQLPKENIREIVAVAGTPTTLAAVVQGRPYAPEVVSNFRLDLPLMREWLQRLARMTVAQRRELPGMDPRRADVIVAGLAVLIAATEVLGGEAVRVSDRGVRFGIALLGEERA